MTVYVLGHQGDGFPKLVPNRAAGLGFGLFR